MRLLKAATVSVMIGIVSMTMSYSVFALTIDLQKQPSANTTQPQIKGRAASEATEATATPQNQASKSN